MSSQRSLGSIRTLTCFDAKCAVDVEHFAARCHGWIPGMTLTLLFDWIAHSLARHLRASGRDARGRYGCLIPHSPVRDVSTPNS